MLCHCVLSSHPALWDLLFCSPANVDNTRFDLTTGMTLICVAVSHTHFFFHFSMQLNIFDVDLIDPSWVHILAIPLRKDNCILTLKKPLPIQAPWLCVVCPWSEVALGWQQAQGPGVVTRCYAVFQNGQSGLTSQWLDVSNDLPCVSGAVSCRAFLPLCSGVGWL